MHIDNEYPVMETRMSGDVMARGANPEAVGTRRVSNPPPHYGDQYDNLISPTEEIPRAQHGIGSVDGPMKTKQASGKRRLRVSKVGKKLLGWIGIRSKDSYESFVCERARMEEGNL